MTIVVDLPQASWDHQWSSADQQDALCALEQGCVLYFPQLRFSIEAGEDRFLSPAIAGKSKNISLDPASGKLRCGSAGEAQLGQLRRMMQRFALSSRTLLRNLLPRYGTGLLEARTSFRPLEISTRSTSWRKDDTRLHVDSFLSTPLQGRRILRVFSNVNPHGKSRTWRLGEPFDTVARRYLPSLPGPLWGSSQFLRLLGITKGRRSPYDHFMLQMHDRMKRDSGYQAGAAQAVQEFRAGSTWMVFTDQVSHAAMNGQFAMEQTHYLPVDRMLDPARSPLRILERLAGRELS